MTSRYYEATRRWRIKCPKKRKEAERRNLKQTAGNSANSNRPWSDTDIALITSQPKEMTDREMSRLIGRPVHPIRSFRWYCKMLAEKNEKLDIQEKKSAVSLEELASRYNS